MRPLPIRLATVAWFALALVWGSEWMLTASLPPAPPLLSLSLRYGLAALLLLPWAWRPRVWQMLWQQGTWRLLQVGAVGAGLLAAPQLLLAAAAHGISPAWSLLALCAVPVLLAIGGHGEISIAVGGFAGAVLLIANSLTMHAAQLPWLVCPLGAAVILAFTLARASSMRGVFDAAMLPAALLLQCVVAAVLTAAAAAALERQPMVWSAGQAVGLVASALLATAAAYLFFYWLLLQIGPARMAMLQWVQLLVAAAESVVLTAARPGWESLLGAVVIAIAVRRAWAAPDAERGVMLQITRP